jgi:hypothetical protein
MIRHRVWLLPALILAIVLAGLAVFLTGEETPLLTEASSWKHIGSIERKEVDPHFVYTDKADPVYWVASREIGNGAGLLVSRSFDGPPWISLTITGDLTRAGNEVFFRRAGQAQSGQEQRLRVAGRTESFFWRRVTVGLPSDWVGKPVELIVEAAPREATNWFGLSNPTALGWSAVLVSHLRVLAVLPALVVSLALFLLPGLPISLYLAKRHVVADYFILPVALIFSGLAGYLTFWAYFLHPQFGRGLGIVMLLSSASVCALDVWRSRSIRSLFVSGEVAISFALAALVGLFYMSLWQSIDLRVPFDLTPRLRMFEFTLAIDNVIPYFFGESMYQGAVPRGLLIPGWHFSDRPPLQAGLLLLQLPLGYLVRQPQNYSLVAGCALQCAWVPAVRALWLAAGLSPRRAGLALLLVVVTGFALVNTVFTWPKMLSAALFTVAVSLALIDRSPKDRATSFIRAILLGLALALAFLAHGGVTFTLLPFGLLLLLPRYYPGLLSLATTGIVAGVTVLPWLLFQTRYDPPGDELIHQHLAGHSKSWVSDQPLWQNLRAAYEDLTVGQILENKWANLAALFRASPHPADDQYPWPPIGSPAPWPVDATALRRCEFLCLVWAPGLLNFGWLAAVISIQHRPLAVNPDLGIAVPCLCVASVLAWVVLMFGPGSTVIHQGSYATVILLFASLAAWITSLRGWLPYLLLVAQGALFAAGWLLTSPANEFGILNGFMAVSALASGAALVRIALGPSVSASDLKMGRRSGSVT